MNKLLSYLRIYFLNTLTYRGDILLFTISGITQPIINIFIWLSISGSAATPLTKIEFIQYFILVILIGTWTSAWAGQFISADIRLGRISPFLLKPVSFIYHQIANNIGEKIIKTIYLLPFAVFLGATFNFKLPLTDYFHVSSFLLAIIFSTLLLFIIDICIGFGAFWLDDTTAIFEFFGISMFFFSGKFIPLAIMPKIIQQMSEFLPLRYMLSFPIEIFLGKLSTREMLTGLVIQSLWLVVFIVIYKLCWTNGLKKYSASGA